MQLSEHYSLIGIHTNGAHTVNVVQIILLLLCFYNCIKVAIFGGRLARSWRKWLRRGFCKDRGSLTMLLVVSGRLMFTVASGACGNAVIHRIPNLCRILLAHNITITLLSLRRVCLCQGLCRTSVRQQTSLLGLAVA